MMRAIRRFGGRPGSGRPTAGLPQDPPSTDVWLVEIEEDEAGLQITGAPVNVSARPGYDNQPSFTADGFWLLYTSQSEGQTDIRAREVDSDRDLQVTATAESEYSPTHIPGVARFSVVRVEADGAQRLWSFPYPEELGGTIGMGPANPYPSRAPMSSEDATLFVPDLEPVGYHAWIREMLAVFILGDPPTLQLAQLFPGTGEVVARNIGRSLHKIPLAYAVSYVDKGTEPWTIRRLDVETREISALAPVLGDGEDLAWTPGGLMVMGNGSELATFRPGADEEWRVIADLAEHGIGGITRLAVSPLATHLALVAAEG